MRGPRRETDDWIFDVAGRQLDDSASAEEIHQLDEELTRDPESFRSYLRFMALNAQLGMVSDSLAAICPQVDEELESFSDERPIIARNSPLARTSSELPSVPAPKGRRRRPLVRFGIVSGGFIAVAVAMLVSWQRALSEIPQVHFERGVGQRFNGPEITTVHQNLIGQQFHLTAGFVELIFRKASATAVIEAPARFRVEDEKTIVVDFGRITAHVSDGAQGLRVLTPEMEVLDHGTRFAVEVSRSRRSEVHVFEGKVEAGAVKSDARQLLTANEAVRINEGLGPEACDLRKGAFVDVDELQRLGAGLRAGQPERARRAFAKLKSDPSALAAFDFDWKESGEDVKIYGARSVQGRFPGTRAIEFVDIEDRARFDRKMTARQFTIMTWVRLNSELKDSDYSSILHTDGWDTVGQVHWMIRCNHEFMGKMRFCIHQGFGEPGKRALTAVSDRSVLDEINRWVHLAITYDGEQQHVTFFMNGRPDSTNHVSLPLLAVLGPAELGNWTPNDNKPRRRLCGRMDELLIHSRALSADEVERYFQESVPYQ